MSHLCTAGDGNVEFTTPKVNLPFRASCYDSQPLRHLLSLTLLRPLGLPWNLNLFQLRLSMEVGPPQAPWRGQASGELQPEFS